ncbi:hypothetical protein ACH5RR_000583 [Cinchona calisaya]|uniref:Uncharacterized protein n=1 Tax=Cinchona calisaya TaxID=153742 RepID=A0ABD3B0Z7_9GENT
MQILEEKYKLVDVLDRDKFDAMNDNNWNFGTRKLHKKSQILNLELNVASSTKDQEAYAQENEDKKGKTAQESEWKAEEGLQDDMVYRIYNCGGILMSHAYHFGDEEEGKPPDNIERNLEASGQTTSSRAVLQVHHQCQESGSSLRRSCSSPGVHVKQMDSSNINIFPNRFTTGDVNKGKVIDKIVELLEEKMSILESDKEKKEEKHNSVQDRKESKYGNPTKTYVHHLKKTH